MFDAWTDYVAVSLTVLQAGIILYAMRLFPILDRQTSKGWAYFILMLCAIFVSRLNFSIRCLDIESYPKIQLSAMGAVTLLAALYVHSKRSRMK